jgi:radical SAM protein with 4Fe4S-binding SPASM domain
MKAIVHSRYSPPDALELTDIGQPVVNDDQVLVRCTPLPSGKVTGSRCEACRTSPACGTGCVSESTAFRGSMWRGALRRSART